MYKIIWYDPHDGEPDFGSKNFATAQEAYDRACELTLESGFEGHFDIWDWEKQQKAEIPNEHGVRF